MSTSHIPFTLADPDWYDVPWGPTSPLLRTRLAAPTPPGWVAHDHGPWHILVPAHPHLPSHGWKVHVSATPDNAADTIAVASRIAAGHHVTHKHLRSRELVHATQLKYAQPTLSGKVLVCYPDDTALPILCRELVAALGPRPAPPVTGELHVPDSPLWLRHGSFVEQWGEHTDGTWNPTVTIGDHTSADRRGTTRTTDDEPDFIRALRSRQASSPRLDVSDVRLLHRSNAGGVYRVLWRGTQPAILKEARPWSGLDAAGVEAGVRLRHEHRVLERLSGSGVAPSPIALLDTPDGQFLVMEDLAAPTVAALMSRRHPLINPRSPETPARYLAWAASVRRQLDHLIEVLEEHQVVHADLQPANLVWRDGKLLAIDFESAVMDGHQAATGIGTPGISRDRDQAVGDRSSLSRVDALLVNPTAAPIVAHHPELLEELRASALADLSGQAAPAPSLKLDTTRLIDGILAAAAPDRDDRLFPGDVAAFTVPGAGTSLLYGASGVLLTLAELQIPIAPAWLGWVGDRAQSRHAAPGFGSGVHGAASALARLGQPDRADHVLRPHRQLFGSDASLGGGAAGRALAWEHLADAGITAARATADAHWDHLARLIRPGAPALPEGLMTGWSGVGLAVLSSPLPERDALARTCLDLSLSSTTSQGPLMWIHQGLTWPYLGRGSAATGLLAAALDPDRLDGHLAALQDRVAAACHAPLVHSAGLLHGRAGILLTLSHLDPSDPAIRLHAHRLAWLSRNLPNGGQALLGDHGLRASTDLGTGSAGALVAISPKPWQMLRRILGLST